MGLRQVEEGFSSILAEIFLAYLIIFQSFAVPLACSTLKNHQITPKIWQKIEEKPSSTCLKLTSPRFRVSDPSLVFYRSSIYLFIYFCYFSRYGIS